MYSSERIIKRLIMKDVEFFGPAKYFMSKRIGHFKKIVTVYFSNISSPYHIEL